MKRFHSFVRIWPGVDVTWTAHRETLQRYFCSLGRGAGKIDESDVHEKHFQADVDDPSTASGKKAFQALRNLKPNSLQLALRIYGDREVFKL